MKKLLSITAIVVAIFLVGCSDKYDDSALVGRVDNLEDRVAKLEQLCNQMNSNINSLQTLVSALQQNDYITGVTSLNENGVEVGYTIAFAKNKSINIYHGKDGENGKDGEDGAPGKDGENGKDGKDGYVPVIGVKQDVDGIYYWTLNQEWLVDDKGNKIKAVGIDGEDGKDGEDGEDGAPGQDGVNGTPGQDGTPGKDGENGKDGVTPKLKIENDYWYISYDNGESWTELGKATGENGADGSDGNSGANGDSMFKEVTQDDTNVYFELADGTMITVPKRVILSITFVESDLKAMNTNSTREVNYTVKSATGKAVVEVTSSADIKAKAIADDKNGLTGKIEIITSGTIDEYSKVVVFVSNDEKIIVKSFAFLTTGIQVTEYSE